MYDLLFSTELTLPNVCFRILAGFFAGAVLGFERRMRQQFVGMRTLILICVSADLLMMLSVYTARNLSVSGTSDPARIAAQVVSGIGFLGAGAIFHQGLNIKGLTSSAIIWATAAIGLALGAGFIVPAAVVLALLELSLVFVEKFEDKVFKSERTKQLHLVFDNKRIDFPLLKSTLAEKGLSVSSTDVKRVMGEKRIDITFIVKAPQDVDIFELTDALKQVANLAEFRLSD
ncbi:MAG: MgtC/SapB family protein [Treponemataceae bacterium]|nr:MgtC/SapB family protein [Treponemataceae bacterium]